MKVDFMIIGASKCGTTTLAKYLELHPEIAFSSVKEPHFFSRYPDWEKHISLYEHFFSPATNKIYGEASTYYSHYPEYAQTPAAIYRYNPNIRLIYIIRNPVDRIYSNYKAYFLRNQLQYPVNEFYKEISTVPLYIDRSRYYTQIKRYLDYFPKEQLHICLFDELISSPATLLNKLFSFLNIQNLSPASLSPSGHLHLNNTDEFIHASAKIEFLAKLFPFAWIPTHIKTYLRPLLKNNINRVNKFDNQTISLIKLQLKSEIHQTGKFIYQDLVEKWGFD